MNKFTFARANCAAYAAPLGIQDFYHLKIHGSAHLLYQGCYRECGIEPTPCLVFNLNLSKIIDSEVEIEFICY